VTGAFDVVTALQLLVHVPDPGKLPSAAARSGPVVAGTVSGRPEECDVRVSGEVLSPLPASGRGPVVARAAGPSAVRSAVLHHLEPFRTAAGGCRLLDLFRVVARSG